jgi:PTS system mannose-specific IIB component
LVEQQRSGPGLVTIMLFASLAAVVQAVADGLSLIELNVGNIRNSTGKLQLVDSVSLDSQDIESLRKLRSHDIRITIQPVPTAPAIDIVDLLQYKGLW